MLYHIFIQLLVGFNDLEFICFEHIFLSEDLDAQNYLAYFRRATAYLAIGRSKAAITDLSKVIELKPDFISVSFNSYFNTFIRFLQIFLGSCATR